MDYLLVKLNWGILNMKWYMISYYFSGSLHFLNITDVLHILYVLHIMGPHVMVNSKQKKIVGVA